MEALNNQLLRRYANFIVIRGRRRIGKSRLIEEFSKQYAKKFLFLGLPPTKGTTNKKQRDEFIRQMEKQGLPAVKNTDWGHIFTALSQAAAHGKVLIVLDEVSWMGSKDPTFLGKLKTVWDEALEKNNELTLIVASSVSSWIDNNILKSTAFFGRVDLTLTLKELPIRDCCLFWGSQGKSISPYEKLKMLSITGGVPKYLKAIQPELPVEKNISLLCFREGGLLFNEFDHIFHDLFSKRSGIYKQIVEFLAAHSSSTQAEIGNAIKHAPDRVFSEYLNDLVTAGFITADFTWNLKTKKISRLRQYRLSDNYLRFYLKYIHPNRARIISGSFESKSLFDAVQWESIMGLQFENLVVSNVQELAPYLGIPYSEVLVQGPFFQKRTASHLGCQIDLMIQTRGDAIYVCEIKFSRNPIGLKIIDDMKRKIDALALPRHLSCRPVLIHVGEVQKDVIGEDYFYRVIDWSKLLT